MEWGWLERGGESFQVEGTDIGGKRKGGSELRLLFEITSSRQGETGRLLRSQTAVVKDECSQPVTLTVRSIGSDCTGSVLS